MVDGDQRMQGRDALGQFFIAFSETEHAIGDLIRSMLRLDKGQDDLVVAALGDFARKANIVKAGLSSAATFGSSPTHDKDPPLDRQLVDLGLRAMSKALAINNIRVPFAHGYLSQNNDGSIDVTHLRITDGKVKNDAVNRTVVEILKSVEDLRAITSDVQKIRRELRSV